MITTALPIQNYALLTDEECDEHEMMGFVPFRYRSLHSTHPTSCCLGVIFVHDKNSL